MQHSSPKQQAKACSPRVRSRPLPNQAARNQTARSQQLRSNQDRKLQTRRIPVLNRAHSRAVAQPQRRSHDLRSPQPSKERKQAQSNRMLSGRARSKQEPSKAVHSNRRLRNKTRQGKQVHRRVALRLEMVARSGKMAALPRAWLAKQSLPPRIQMKAARKTRTKHNKRAKVH
jgi:hypothetical protein